MVQIVRSRKNHLRLLEADAPMRIGPQALAFARIEVERMYNCYTIFGRLPQARGIFEG